MTFFQNTKILLRRFAGGTAFAPWRFGLLTLPLLLLTQISLSQNDLSNRRSQVVELSPDWQTLDSLAIVPQSVNLLDATTLLPLDSVLYEIRSGDIRFSGFGEAGRRATVHYRVFPFNFTTPVSRLDTSLLRQAYEGLPFAYPTSPADRSPLAPGKLQTNGSFARGLSFGNSQNLVLNSSFNLQMSGQLTDDIVIAAALTDNSLPLQPEGNTLQLQEFDRVYIQLKRKQATLTAGDYELARPQGRHFLNYFKKLQGATLRLPPQPIFAERRPPLPEGGNKNLPKGDMPPARTGLGTNASVAIARGKYARNIVAPQEGNQGPYRLRGAEGETFIIVLAGTERVYLNGQLLTRGIEADYTIDYNAATLSFMPRHLINKNSRIVVEFDYTDLSYLRSLYAIDLDYTSHRSRTYLSIYADQDAKNSTLDRTLSDTDKLALRTAGDNPLGAIVSGLERLDEYNPLRVTYALIDTVICGRRDSILRFSTDRGVALYTARFTEVGAGNGHYVLDRTSAANGRVYRWVAPTGCQPAGNFAPITRLVAPKQQQMLSAGTQFPLPGNTAVRTEISLSNLDLNRFSDSGESDDTGWAAFAEVQNTSRLGADSSSSMRLRSSLRYEFAHRSFNFVAQYRPQEFSRDWNLSNARLGQLGESALPRASEHLLHTSLHLDKPAWGSLEYGFGGFWQELGYAGIRHFSRVSLSRNGFSGWAEGSWLLSDTDLEHGSYLRPRLSVEKTFASLGNWKIGLLAEQEKNNRSDASADSLLLTSFRYDFAKAYLQSPTEGKLSAGMSASRRWDFLPEGSAFQNSSAANQLEFYGAWQHGKQNRLDWNLNYRQLEVDSVVAGFERQEPASTYLGRLTYTLGLWRGAVQANTSYEIGSGQEPRIEFNYLRVNDGEGVYQWNDYNLDSVPQIGEFEVAVFRDSATFVRVSTVTNEFIRTDQVQFNQNLRLEPRTIWYGAKGWRRLVARFSTLSTWQVNRRVRKAEQVSAWNPFQLDIVDTALVALSFASNHTIFFNRSDPKFDLQLRLADNQNRWVVTTGYEARRLSEQGLTGRWNVSKVWSLRSEVGHFRKESDTENFLSRNYRIEGWRLKPELTWQPGANFRTSLSYIWQASRNRLGDQGESARQHNFGSEVVLNFGGQQQHPVSVRLRANYALVQFTGAANSPVGFALLEGLRDGRNLLWMLSLDRQLARNIRLSLQYDGRKTGDARMVHVGRAQVGAVF